MNADTSKYTDATDSKWKIVDVPLKVATEENFREYGRLVPDLEKEQVYMTPWPVQGRRPLHEGTGVGASVAHGVNEHHWVGDLIFSHNKAVEYGAYCSGRLPADVTPDNRTHVLVREANYHPDSGQVWFPSRGEAFVMLLALPTDDVTPESFVAFYFDGSCGLQVKPGVWHQPPYQMDDHAEIKGKQGSVFACVMVDTVDEFNCFMRVPIKRELAVNA